MMLEKERGDLVGTEFGTMWTRSTLSNGRTGHALRENADANADSIRYTNVVNGVMKENPDPYYGGILADVSQSTTRILSRWSRAHSKQEMGLGKSLAIIALIATSLDYLEKNSSLSPHPTGFEGFEEYHVQSQPRSTLVVTPRVSKSGGL